MRFINATDLTYKSDAELISLIHRASESLQDMDVSGQEYAATICSIAIIRRALVARRMSGPKF